MTWWICANFPLCRSVYIGFPLVIALPCPVFVMFGGIDIPLPIHRRFMSALKAQGISRDDLPYKAPFQPYGNYFALISTGIIAFFKGFDTFMPWNKSELSSPAPIFRTFGWLMYFRIDIANFVTYETWHLFLIGELLTLCRTCHFRSYIGFPVFFVLWLVRYYYYYFSS